MTGKRILLSIHLLLNAVWIGGVATILFVNATRESAASADQLHAVNLLLFRIHDGIVMNIGFGVIITGLLFSLFTKWGFFDFAWVVVKWVGLVVMFVVITFLLAPAVNGMAALADVEGLNALSNADYAQYHLHTTLYTALLLLLFLPIVGVSVFKPWGPRKKPFRTNRKVVLVSGIVFGVLTLAAVSMQFMQLESYRRLPVKDIDLSSIEDGTYIGRVHLGFEYKVEMTVENHRITRITVLDNYPSLYATLAEGITTKVLLKQSLHVRAVTGATTTSKALLKAMENSLEAR